jgi:ligand-binding sensor domain-containing protein/signal transduction histidine kinase
MIVMNRLFRSFRLSVLLWIVYGGIVSFMASAPALGLDPRTSLGQYTKQGWTTENGLPQNSVHAVLQTSDGFLWLATESGLARFDGYQFQIFDGESAPRLPGNDVRCLAQDRSGGLWIGTASGLTRMKDGKLLTLTMADGLPSDAVRSMLVTPDGMLWVLTAGGLAAVKIENNEGKASVHTFSEKDGLSSTMVMGMADAGDGGVWVGTANGLDRIVDMRVERGPRGASGLPIEALVKDGTNGLLVATPDGVQRLVDGSLTLLARKASLPPGAVRQLLSTSSGVFVTGKNSAVLIQSKGILTFATGHDLPGTQIETIMEDRQGAVWIGTNAGLARWWHGKLEQFKGGAELATTAVLSIHEDREGDLWVGTETAGVKVLRDPAYEIIGPAQGLQDQAATSVVQAEGNLWIGTDGGGLTRIGMAARSVGSRVGEAAHTYTSKSGLASDTVLALAPGVGNSRDAAGQRDLWVGTPDGLNQLHEGRWTGYTAADGLADDLVRSLMVARDGAVWAGTRRGVTRWKDGRTTTWTTASGLGSDLVGAMLEDVAGDLWIGTLGGLSRIHEGKVRNYTTGDGLPSNTITALEAGADGVLWIGTKSHGLARWDGSGFFSFAGADTLPHEIYAIIEDEGGALWISSAHGIDRLAVADLDAFRVGRVRVVPAVHYGTTDGLPSLDGASTGHPSAWRMTDGRICFATRRGVLILDPARLKRAEIAPQVVLEQITVDDRRVTPAEFASVPPGPSHFSFSFAGISLAAPQRVQCRYMLGGFDRDWVEAGARRTAFYTNLPPGRYRFRVTARNTGGVWSETGAEVWFELQPHYYQTVWFRVLLVILITALFFGFYRLRMRRLRKGFDAVAAERSRIAREIHDTLAQGFVAISVRLEMMSQMLRTGRVDNCREQLDETRGMVREGLAEARRSIWNLRTEGADAETLPARLARFVQEAVSRGTDAQLQTTGIYRPLERRVEDELQRIAQEAFTNAIRHSGGKTIRLRLNYVEDYVSLEVIDDGCGFDISQAASNKQGHFGLTGIRERAQQIGATVMLESKPGHGTTVRVEMPFSRVGSARRRKT